MGKFSFFEVALLIGARELLRSQRDNARAQIYQLQLQEREALRRQRETEKEQRAIEKKYYVDDRRLEAEAMTVEVRNQVKALRSILLDTLSINDVVHFESLKSTDEFIPEPFPTTQLNPLIKPIPANYREGLEKPSKWRQKLGWTGNYEEEFQRRKQAYEDDHRKWVVAEQEFQRHFSQYQSEVAVRRMAFEAERQAHNELIDDFATKYFAAEPDYILSYTAIVLGNSRYPDAVLPIHQLDYASATREIVDNCTLPDMSVVPIISDYRYVKTRDSIEPRPRGSRETLDIYQDLLAGIALRTVHEIFEADQCKSIDSVVFNGFIDGIDAATGLPRARCVIAARISKQAFELVDLSRVDNRACLQRFNTDSNLLSNSLTTIQPKVVWTGR